MPKALGLKAWFSWGSFLVSIIDYLFEHRHCNTIKRNRSFSCTSISFKCSFKSRISSRYLYSFVYLWLILMFICVDSNHNNKRNCVSKTSKSSNKYVLFCRSSTNKKKNNEFPRTETDCQLKRGDAFWSNVAFHIVWLITTGWLPTTI